MKLRLILPLLLMMASTGLHAAANDNTLLIPQNVRRTCMARITEQIAKPSTSTEKILRLEQMYNHHLENLESNEENKAFIQEHTPAFRNAIKERNKSLKKNIKNLLKIIKSDPDQKDTLRQEIIETLPKLSPCDETDDFLHGFYRKFDRAFALQTIPFEIKSPIVDTLIAFNEQEQKSIKAIFYCFTYEKFADSLIEARKRIPVEVIVDRQHMNMNILKKLEDGNVSVMISASPGANASYHKTHIKALLYEHNEMYGRSLLVSGSANATLQGLSGEASKNDEWMECNDGSNLIQSFAKRYKLIESTALTREVYHTYHAKPHAV